MLTGCSPSKDSLYNKLSKDDLGNTRYEGHFKIGGSYSIRGKTYTPIKKTTHLQYNETGIASWYNDHGKKTANGERFNQYSLTAAHRTLPLPCVVKVTNIRNNKSLIVMLNDRGPFPRAPHKDRIIDVSAKAASLLGFKTAGLTMVKVEYLHEETKILLAKLNLEATHGSKSKYKVKNPECTVNCHIKLVNLKYKLAKTF